MLRGKKIILGVTGSIAAYKSALLVREFVKAGAEVQVIMTEASREFITPLTLSTLSKHPVLYRFTDDPKSGEWNNHVELGIWADMMVIAPCSAHTMGKMIQGICDNLLMATYLSARCEVYIAPAMDLDMYAHASTQENIEMLRSRGVKVIEPQSGELASGLSGQGRMTEPEDIREFIVNDRSGGIDLTGKKVMVTAGPTYEDIDPVRFIGNRSTGRMGFALATAAADMGADVHLIHGPVTLQLEHERVQCQEVRSAAEMYSACKEVSPECDLIIMAAAVADYTPAQAFESKLKKTSGPLNLELERTQDILMALSDSRADGQRLVGFALETESAKKHARSKLERKNLDAIVLNTLEDSGAGFAHETNKVTILTRDNKEFDFELKSKSEVALDILSTIYNEFYA